MLHLHAFLVAAGADAQKGDAVAVRRVHVRLDLEHEAGELGLARVDTALFRRPRARRRRVLGECIEQFLDAEVVDGRAKKHRGLLAAQVGVDVEFVAGTAHQFDLVAQLLRLVAEHLVEARVVQAMDLLADGDASAVVRVVQVHSLVAQVEHALEALAHADRPGDRGALDLQHLLDLVEQFDRLAALAVELVDKG